MRSVYVNWRWVPLCALLALVGCAGNPRTIDSVPTDWHATTDPVATVDAFVTAWNRGERADVLATFEKSRRVTIDSATVFDERLTAWEAVHHVVLDQCIARGAFFKTALVTFADRRSGASIEEIVWIHLHDGGWWMYSL